MKKFIKCLLFPMMALSVSSCALLEIQENQKLVIDLGDDEEYVRWNLVENNNEYRPVQSAYFEINKDKIKYYENDTLKKEGDVQATYHGLDKTTRPLTILLKFGYGENRFRIYDELICYTEDEKENVHQFSIMAEGYHIDPIRMGGVPIRDYHLSEMPYAYGTYVKQGTTETTYKNDRKGKVGESTYLTGTFISQQDHKFYFLNSSFVTNQGYYYSSARTYFRYENTVKNIFLEGTISLTWADSYQYGRRVNYALLRVTHGEDEPSSQKGVVIEPDYHLVDFNFDNENQFSFVKGEYFYDHKECDWDPVDFVPGLYTKAQEN